MLAVLTIIIIIMNNSDIGSGYDYDDENRDEFDFGGYYDYYLFSIIFILCYDLIKVMV